MEKLLTESNLAEHEDLPFNLQGEVDLPVFVKSGRFTCDSKTRNTET